MQIYVLISRILLQELFFNAQLRPKVKILNTLSKI